MITAFSLLAQAQQPGSLFQSPMVLMVLMMVMMYFVMIRPQRKAQKELAAKIAALKKGDIVVLHSGLHATVSQVQEKTLVVILGEAGKVKVEKAGVATVLRSSEASDSSSAANATVEAEVVEEKK